MGRAVFRVTGRIRDETGSPVAGVQVLAHFTQRHPQGGNRMGRDPAFSVVDSNCRVHGFENLFVCDASVFPTALGVNPQMTVMALATIEAGRIGSL